MLKEGTNLKYLPFVIIGLIIVVLIVLYVANQRIVMFGADGSGSGSGCPPSGAPSKTLDCSDRHTVVCCDPNNEKCDWDDEKKTPVCKSLCPPPDNPNSTEVCRGYDSIKKKAIYTCCTSTQDCKQTRSGEVKCVDDCPRSGDPLENTEECDGNLGGFTQRVCCKPGECFPNGGGPGRPICG